jgi:hypothetical protein
VGLQLRPSTLSQITEVWSTHDAKLSIEVILGVLFQRVEWCVVVNGRLESRMVIVTQDVHEVQIPGIITHRGCFCIISNLMIEATGFSETLKTI